MIIDKEGMKEIESASGIPAKDLMEQVGSALAERLRTAVKPGARILFLCGKGNNGGDGLVTARLLAKEYQCRIFLCQGKPSTKESKAAYRRLPKHSVLEKEEMREFLQEADLIVDAVYGFGFHGTLSEPMKALFSEINHSGRPVISIDINSGCECDTGTCDASAIRSDVTLAIDCWKPFHMLRKEHGMFKSAELLDLGLPHPEKSPFHEMNETLFFDSFPKKEENAYKGTFGKTLLIGGSYGMAGALGLNLTGAKTVGAPYIQTALPEEIYPIVASNFMTPVYHPFNGENWHSVLEPLVHSSAAIGFGSGASNMYHRDEILDLILQESRCPVVLDAAAIRLLVHNMYILRFVKVPVILTPHIGEFSELTGLPVAVIRDSRIKTASDFAKDYHVIVVLKGANTVVAFPDGECYINQSGSQALAQAGSGDLLTGILTGILTFTRDVETAVCMAVWLHGYLAEYGMDRHSIHSFPLSCYPELMDELFRKHGR